MKLLTPPEGKSRLAVQNASQEVRAIELDKLITGKRRELSRIDADLLKAMGEVGRKGIEEEQFWKAKVVALTREVEGLESRRKSALVPLESREKEAKNKEEALLRREEYAAMRESDNDSERQALEDRLDEVSEREEEATKYSVLLNNREFTLSIQEKQLKERMEALTTILVESLEEVKKSQAETARYKAILKGRDVSVAEREKYVEEREASFANRELSILDKYRTLQKAITEVNLTNRVNSIP